MEPHGLCPWYLSSRPSLASARDSSARIPRPRAEGWGGIPSDAPRGFPHAFLRKQEWGCGGASRGIAHQLECCCPPFLRDHKPRKPSKKPLGLSVFSFFGCDLTGSTGAC